MIADDRSINYSFSGGLANHLSIGWTAVGFSTSLFIFLCLHHPENKQLYNPNNNYVKYLLKSLKAQKYGIVKLTFTFN